MSDVTRPLRGWRRGIVATATLLLASLVRESPLSAADPLPPRAASAGFSILHSFNGVDGSGPRGSLALDASGRLFGTTSHGGGDGYAGTVYSLRVDGTGFDVLFRFPADQELHPESGVTRDGSGHLFGTAHSDSPATSRSGVAFTLNEDGAGFAQLHAFFHPASGDDAFGPSSLTLDGYGNLFGMTFADVSAVHGTVFTLKTDGSGYGVVHAFGGGVGDGSRPERGGLIQDASGTLLGVTTFGGQSDVGTLFAVNGYGTDFTVLHHFEVSPGAQNPTGRLALDRSGNLYGTTFHGGTSGGSGEGTVYTVKPDGTAFAILHSFGSGGADPRNPLAGLLLGPGGNLYGTTMMGGSSNFGTVFTLKTDGSGFQVLHSFARPDGEYPDSELVIDNAGWLYGVADGGGDDRGVVFTLPSMTVAAPTSFYTLPPCRLLDTRAEDGPLGGPALQAGIRTFALSGTCSAPTDAKSLAANVTVVAPTHDGDLRLFASDDTATPVASTISFAAGKVRANSVLLQVSRDGTASVDVQADLPEGGSVHLVVDVVGFFR